MPDDQMIEEVFPTKGSVAAYQQDDVDQRHKRLGGVVHRYRDEPKVCECEGCYPPLTGRYGQLLRRMRRRRTERRAEKERHATWKRRYGQRPWEDE